jgi:hypothetical protein
MKAEELARVLMQNPDYDVKINVYACKNILDFRSLSICPDDGIYSVSEENVVFIDVECYK